MRSSTTMYAHAERLQIVANGSTWFQMKRGGTKAKRWRERMSSVADDRSVVPMIGAHVENGIRRVASHYWWVLMGKCSTLNISQVWFHIFTTLCRKSNAVRKQADWAPIFETLKKSKKRLITWCPSIEPLYIYKNFLSRSRIGTQSARLRTALLT